MFLNFGNLRNIARVPFFSVLVGCAIPTVAQVEGIDIKLKITFFSTTVGGTKE